MKRSEQVIDLIWVSFAIFVCVLSLRLKLGTFSEPAPGFLPFLTGALLGIAAIIHLSVGLYDKSPSDFVSPDWKSVNWRRALYVILATAAYAVLLPFLGYIVDTIFLIASLSFLMREKRWWITILYTVCTVGFSYALFGMWLQVQFPTGFWG